jgi:hypothetical protein
MRARKDADKSPSAFVITAEGREALANAGIAGEVGGGLGVIEGGPPVTMAQAIKAVVQSAGGKVTSDQIKDKINADYPDRWKASTLQAHLYACAVNNPKAYIHHPFVERFLFRHGDGTLEMYSEQLHGPNVWAPDDPQAEGEGDSEATKDEPATKKQFDLFGFPVSAVLRWMGKQGWTFGEARTVLNSLGLSAVADGTINAYLLAGRKGQRGDPADLLPADIQQLESVRKNATLPPGEG